MKHIAIFLYFLSLNPVWAQKSIDFKDFIPSRFVLYDNISGDLNQDGLEDIVLIIKDTQEGNVTKNRFGEMVDRNRRGIVILFQTENGFKQMILNKRCFESENEDGGAYYPPELDVSIDHNKLFINYNHGRYGSWYYTFRYQNNDFVLIGYDHTDRSGPIINSEISINFLTKKKKELLNMKSNIEDSGEEEFKEFWSEIKDKELIKLSEINEFYDLYF